jgi:hypothetical protein
VKPTPKQVQAEIEKLEEIKPRVRRYSMFGDDHHASIEAQIDVLRKNLDNDAIYDSFDGKESILDNAIQAQQWRDGESEEGAPSVGWAELAV